MSLFDFIRRLNQTLTLHSTLYRFKDTEQMTIQQTNDMLAKYQ
ncbi:hypothetical protein [Legionella sainthelensi]|nr:hypothetical protein [Legionella sainthelensi]